jgi:probable HAF family extracellular repeat protein
VTDLGTLGGLSAQAYDINDAGQIVGYATTAASGARAFRWQDGVMTDLGTLGGPSSQANAINALGSVVGSSRISTGSATHAMLWVNGIRTDLTPSHDGSVASAINDAGQVVGTKSHAMAFLWQNGVTTDLGHLGGGGSFGADINGAGVVVGAAYTNHVTELGPMRHAFVWANGMMTDLGVLPGTDESGASAINNAGQIVGSSGHTDPVSYEVTSQSFVYENGQMFALPVPSSESGAADINDAGVIVGTMRAAGGFSSHHGYVYADGVATNLNALIAPGSGLHIAWATAINNAGQISAVAYDARGGYHAVLLTPVAPDTPVIAIADASVSEGHGGTRSATLTVALSAPSTAPVTVSYATANGSAVAGSDYEPASGSVTFAAGETSRTLSIEITGDRIGEPNERVLVNLSHASDGAAIGDGQAVITIADDEPRLTIGDVSRNEGHAGTTAFTFTVTLSQASDVPVIVSFATADGSARAGEDFAAASGQLTFAAGQTARTIGVAVTGDRRSEGQEVFYVNLSAAAAGFVTDSQGTGIIRNDDR